MNDNTIELIASIEPPSSSAHVFDFCLKMEKGIKK
jgi:hypothetical protein